VDHYLLFQSPATGIKKSYNSTLEKKPPGVSYHITRKSGFNKIFTGGVFMELFSGAGKQFRHVSCTEAQTDNNRGDSDQIEPLRDIDDLCRLLDVPKKTVYKWTSDRHTGFPYYKVGKHLRFRFSEVDSYLRKYRASEGVREFSLTPQKGDVKKRQ
jgi:excisionase family DNA binding protein